MKENVGQNRKTEQKHQKMMGIPFDFMKTIDKTVKFLYNISW